MTNLRYSIFVAVSSKRQAQPDKVSLSEQETRCRAAGKSKGWIDTGLTYIVPGESRTRYVDLSVAEQKIPALKDMLDAAQRKDFDVLILYDYNRLRDLIDPIAKTLMSYGADLYSINQPTDLSEDQNNDSASIIQFTAGLTSRLEIATMKRRYRVGMPPRITQKGLPPSRIRYGYRKPPGRETDANAIPEQDPAKAAIVIQIKDLFLSGKSLWQIANHLNAQNIPTPGSAKRWTDVMTRHVLTSRFYCGEIVFGLERRHVDPRTGRVTTVINPPSRVVVGQGKHTPLWDKTTQARIDAEFKRRGRTYSGKRTHRLSNLLYCGICGARVYVKYTGGRVTEEGRLWECKEDNSHVRISDAVLLQRVVDELLPILENVKNIKIPLPEIDTAQLQATLEDLEARKGRLLDLYEDGKIPMLEYNRRVMSLDIRIFEAQEKLASSENVVERHAERMATLEGLAGIIKKVPKYIFTAPEQNVNTQLCHILERITVTPNSTVLKRLE